MFLQLINIILNFRTASSNLHIACSDQPYEENSKITPVVQPHYAKSAGHAIFAINFHIVFRRTRDVFEKPKEAFVNNGPNKKILSFFAHVSYFGGFKWTFFSLFFRFKYLMISCFVINFWPGSREYEEEFFKTGRGFSQARVHLKKNLSVL
jgi:hypothetical protein